VLLLVKEICSYFLLLQRHFSKKIYKPVDELAGALLSYKRPTRRCRTATVPIIRSFHMGVVGLRQKILLKEV